jgi:hypothetical protein
MSYTGGTQCASATIYQDCASNDTATDICRIPAGTQSTGEGVRFNGWWVEGTANSSAGSDSWRIQYAYFPSQQRYDYHKITWDFAPICEFAEVEPAKFKRYLRRLREDPAYRAQQLRAQERLFASQNECPLWLTDGLRLLHRIIGAGISLEEFSSIIKTINFDRLPLNLTSFLGVPAKTDEIFRLKDLFTNPHNQGLCERLPELLEAYAKTALRQELFLERLETARVLPVLTPEQRKAADLNAIRLLKAVLSPSEIKGLIQDGHIKIPSLADPEVVYLIKRKPYEKIQVLKKNKLVDSLCIFFNEPMHNDDVVLAKVMMMKHSEQAALQIANHFPR